MKHLFPLILIFSCLLLSQQASAKVYKWTDAKGQVHYSEHPPANQSNEVIKPKTGHSDPVSYATASASSVADETTKTGQEVIAHMKDPQRCAAAQKNQGILQTATRVQFKDDKGQQRYLTPDELKQKMDEASRAIDESC